MKFVIPKIESTALLNDLPQTRQELLEVVEHFEKSIVALENLSASDIEMFVRFRRLKKSALEQLGFIKRKRVQRDVNFLRVEKQHALRFHPPSESSTFVQTRSCLAAMTDQERQQKLDDALKNKNHLIIQSVMHWPDFLCGLTDIEHEKFCEQAKKVLSAEKINEIESAQKQLKILFKALTDAVEYVEGHTIEEESVAI